jgi:HPt (histidine-containing phosphotransfer) domain-containing protein
MSDLEEEITNEIFLEELKQEFFETTAGNIEAMGKLFTNKDYQKISEIAHDIKGTAGLFGFDEGSEIANRLIQSTNRKKPKEINKLINKLKDYMKKNGIIE